MKRFCATTVIAVLLAVGPLQGAAEAGRVAERGRGWSVRGLRVATTITISHVGKHTAWAEGYVKYSNTTNRKMNLACEIIYMQGLRVMKTVGSRVSVSRRSYLYQDFFAGWDNDGYRLLVTVSSRCARV